MEEIFEELRRVATLEQIAFGGDGPVSVLETVAEQDAAADYRHAAYDLGHADLLRAVECTQQANRELAEQNLRLAQRLGNPPAWLAPGTPEVGGPSSLDYADEETGPVTGCVLPSEGVSRLQVRQAAAKVACCGLVAEAVLLRLLLDEVERLQQLEAGKEVARA